MRRRVISLISEKEETGMTDKNVFKKNRNFYIGIAGTVGEGLAFRQPVPAALYSHAAFVERNI